MYHIAICDDQPEEAIQLKKMILDCAQDRRLQIHLFRSGDALLQAYEKGNAAFGAVFMDIYMAGIDGIETVRELRKIDAALPVIFCTSSPDFAVESYDLEASGYLLKPCSQEKVNACMERIFRQKKEPKLALKKGRTFQYIAYDSICYLESIGRTTYIHLAGHETTDTYLKLNELERLLEDERFLRCHQSFLVNMDYVKKVEEVFWLNSGDQVPIRVRQRKEIAERYYKYFVKQQLGEKYN